MSGCATLVRQVFTSPLSNFVHVAVCVFCFVFFVSRAQGEEETFAGVTGVVGKAAGEWEAGRRSPPPGSSSYRRRSVGVVQHGVEGAGEVVGVVAAVVLLRHGHQAGQADEEEEEQVDGERRSEDAQHEGLTLRGGGGGDGGGGAGGGRGGGAIQKVRTGGNAASGAWRSAPAVAPAALMVSWAGLTTFASGRSLATLGGRPRQRGDRAADV